MKISKVLFALIGCQHSTTALPLSDELKTLSNFDFWANSVTSQVPFGKAAVSLILLKGWSLKIELVVTWCAPYRVALCDLPTP